MQSHKTAGIQLARKFDLLAIDSRGKFRIWETHLSRIICQKDVYMTLKILQTCRLSSLDV